LACLGVPGWASVIWVAMGLLSWGVGGVVFGFPCQGVPVWGWVVWGALGGCWWGVSGRPSNPVSIDLLQRLQVVARPRMASEHSVTAEFCQRRGRIPSRCDHKRVRPHIGVGHHRRLEDHGSHVGQYLLLQVALDRRTSSGLFLPSDDGDESANTHHIPQR
jgi:hypothetical protein